MSKLKTRLSAILIGFLVLAIPLALFNYNLNKLYISTKDNIQENLKENLLWTANELKKNTEPQAYLNTYFDQLHPKLFPTCPQSIIKQIPDDDFVKNLYNKDVFYKLASYTIEQFKPIMICMSNIELDKDYNYLSKELLNQLPNDKEQKKLLISKKFYDIEILSDDYAGIFNNNFDKSKAVKFVNKSGFKTTCFEYLSRFSDFRYFTEGTYTDYFGKQIIYNIVKSINSPKGIHGYYSILIPQDRVNPDNIVKTAISQNIRNNIKIEIIDDKNNSKLEETDNGVEYYLKFPTSFVKHIKTYNERNKTSNNILNKQYMVTASYPEALYKQKDYNKIIIGLSIAVLIAYLIISVLLLLKKLTLPINLTAKLLTILSIVVFLPIFGIALTFWLSIQNIDKIIEDNISKSLHNELENIFFYNQENNRRMVSAIFEMKRQISQKRFNKDAQSLFDCVLEKPDRFPNMLSNTWYTMWLNDLVVYTEDGDLLLFDDAGTRKKETGHKNRLDNDASEELGYIVNKYMDNLGITKKKQPAPGTKSYENYLRYEMRKTYSLAFMDKYLLPEIEADTAGQESIPSRDVQNFTDSALSIYYYAKDVDGKQYYINHKKSGSKTRTYDYMEYFIRGKNHFWFMPKHRFSTLSIATCFNNRRVVKSRQWPYNKDCPDDINALLNEAKKRQDSILFKQNSEKGTTIKEIIYRDKDPFILSGIAKSNNNNSLSFYLYLMLGSLICYTSILLTVVTRFISVFIEKPVSIYKNAINKLSNKEFGVTIRSFSKDEFDSVTNAFNEMSIALKQKEQIKRYVSDRLVKSVQENTVTEAGDGKAETLTVLSSDIRNFTGTSECHTPAEIVEMLNSYFTLMQQAISAQNGIIDKYIGDAIQAVFYNEPDKEHHIIRACRAALAMRKALSELNASREKAGLFTIENGIGIDTDVAITGTIGTENGRKDYTVYGAVIDRAAALEAKTKGTKSKILLSSISASEVSEFITGNKFDEESVELIDVK